MPPGTKNTIEVELRGKIEHLEGRLKTAETALESMSDKTEKEGSRTKRAQGVAET